jgi:hypothetical protein
VTALVFVALGSLGVLDGAFSGFRASLGRSGLVDHRAEDRRGLLTGAALVAVLAVPALAAMAVDLLLLAGEPAVYRDLGRWFLTVVGPYAVVVLVALAVYAGLRWELKYLASALVLGPFTLARPYVVAAATLVAVLHTRAVGASVAIVLAALAVLLVEPVLDRRLRRRASRSSPPQGWRRRRPRTNTW